MQGRLKQSVTKGVFGRSMAFEDTCREAARLGIKGYDLIGPEDWPTLKKYGLVPAMYPPGPVAPFRTLSTAKRITQSSTLLCASPLTKRWQTVCPISSRSPAIDEGWTIAKAPTTASFS